MADNNFFNLLRDKMAALQPVEQHRKDDWAALGARLDVALPQPPRKRRRAIVLPLLLIAALLSSNAVWWQSSRSDRAALARLDAQVTGLQAVVSALPAKVSQVVVRTDTIWRTVYVQRVASNQQSPFGNVTQHSLGSKILSAVYLSEIQLGSAHGSVEGGLNANGLSDEVPGGANATRLVDGPDKQKSITSNAVDSVTQVAALPNLATPHPTVLDLPKRKISLPQNLIGSFKEEKPTEPFGRNLLDALYPKFFKLGSNIGWLYASSTGLMHEGGFSYNLRGQIGFSRHWSITTDFGMGKVHYKAHTPEAVLGAPDLPLLPSMEHHFAEVDVTGQNIRQFDLSLRYTFAQPGKFRPYLAFGWGAQTLQPFTVEYEIQHEPTGTIQKGVFSVRERTYQRNILGVSAGLDIPLSSRWNLMLEGFYKRQWRKPSGMAPDLTGIRSGVNWLF